MNNYEEGFRVSDIYQKISELAEEITFEYQVKQDRLLLSEEFEAQFGKNRIVEHYREKQKDGMLWDFFDLLLHWEEKVLRLELLLETMKGFRWYQVTAYMIRNEAGEALYGIGRMSSIDELKQKEYSILEKMKLDSLTGIYNRLACETEICSYLQAGERQGRAGFFMIDLDDFKMINDKMGHMAGDKVLKESAGILTQVFEGKQGVIGRWGGDEFAVFLWEAGDEQEVSRLAEEICNRLRRPYEGNGHRIFQTVSVGFAYAWGKESFKELYQAADQALYQVKADGRNGYRIFRERV